LAEQERVSAADTLIECPQQRLTFKPTVKRF
jgi:hypothetical protein